MPTNYPTAAASQSCSDDDWESQTFYEAVERAIRQFGGGHRAFRFEAENLDWTLEELCEHAHRFGRAFVANGLTPGGAVAVWAPGRSLWPVAELGITAVGAAVCGLNTRYRYDELRHVLSTVKPRFIFVATDFLGIDSLGLVGNALDALRAEGAAHDWDCEVIACPPVTASSSTSELRTLGDFLADGDDVPERELAKAARRVAPDDTAIVQFTSGSTGHPKGVTLSHDAALRSAHHISRCQGLGPSDVMYSALPFYHMGGTICTTLIAIVGGTTMVVAERFDAQAAAQSIKREACTAYQGHATMYSMLLDELRRSPRDVSSLRKGWAVAPAPLMRRIHDELQMTDVVPTYGLSEFGIATGCVPTDPLEKRLGTVGRPVPGVSLSLRDPDTREETSGMGEIWLRGPHVMSGYLDDPEATSAVFRDGWLATGDLGELDEDGFLKFGGRLKEMLKPGGENVSVAEVERFLLEDPRVGQAAIVGIPDDRLGEVPAAVIEPVDGALLSSEEVIARCREGIANFKAPRKVWFVARLPTLGPGKIDRVRVREQVAAALARGG